MPRRYWTDMKLRVQDEGFREVYAKCVQLKMLAPDGRQRPTEAANEQTLLRIIQSIPSPKAEPFKQWLAQVGHERLEEMRDPSLAADRMRKNYAALGYTDEWIAQRLKGVTIRDELTQEWRERGAHEGREFATLTDTIHNGTFDLSTAEHRDVKRIGARSNLRDSMTNMELLLTSLGEEATKGLHQARDSQGFDELRSDAHEGGEFAGATRQQYESPHRTPRRQRRERQDPAPGPPARTAIATLPRRSTRRVI
ncbi:MAG TPA: BRO family protein [Ktedonobacterales bacterium]